MKAAPPLRYWLPYQLLGTRVPATYKEWVKDDIAAPLFPEKDLFRSLVLVGIFAAVLALGMHEPLSTHLRKQQKGWDGPSDKSSHGWREEIGRGLDRFRRHYYGFPLLMATNVPNV